MAFGKAKGKGKAPSTEITVEALQAQLAMLLKAQGGGTKPAKAGKVGRPPMPEANEVEISDGDKEGFVNITFTHEGEPAKPDDETLTKLKLYGFRWAPSKRQWYGIAFNVPSFLCEAAGFERPEVE